MLRMLIYCLALVIISALALTLWLAAVASIWQPHERGLPLWLAWPAAIVGAILFALVLFDRLPPFNKRK